MGEITRDEIERELPSPWPEPEKLSITLEIEQLLNTQERIEKQLAGPQKEVDNLKAKLKEIKGNVEGQLGKLHRGKPVKVMCSRTFDWDNNTVCIVRDDTHEVVEEREPTADERTNIGLFQEQVAEGEDSTNEVGPTEEAAQAEALEDESDAAA